MENSSQDFCFRGKFLDEWMIFIELILCRHRADHSGGHIIQVIQGLRADELRENTMTIPCLLHLNFFFVFFFCLNFNLGKYNSHQTQIKSNSIQSHANSRPLFIEVRYRQQWMKIERRVSGNNGGDEDVTRAAYSATGTHFGALGNWVLATTSSVRSTNKVVLKSPSHFATTFLFFFLLIIWLVVFGYWKVVVKKTWKWRGKEEEEGCTRQMCKKTDRNHRQMANSTLHRGDGQIPSWPLLPWACFCRHWQSRQWLFSCFLSFRHQTRHCWF